MHKYHEDELWNMTNDELRSICKEIGIIGMSKKKKQIIIEAILDVQTASEEIQATSHYSSDYDYDGFAPDSRPITDMVSVLDSKAQDPEDSRSDMNTTIYVSCGASSGNFSVVGKTVGEVAAKLTNILNISSLASGVVNGNSVDESYILRDGDFLEFVKPAGNKGL